MTGNALVMVDLALLLAGIAIIINCMLWILSSQT